MEHLLYARLDDRAPLFRWDEDVACRSPRAAKQPLADDVIDAKRRELQQLARSSFAWRAFTYFMGCFACQTFWAAVAVFAVTRGVDNLAGCIFTAAASSGAGVLLSLAGTTGQNRRTGGSSEVACKSRGE